METKGANVNIIKYNTNDSIIFHKNIVEQSLCSKSLFCINADPNPPSIKTLEIVMNIARRPIHPKSSGDNKRAKIILEIKDMSITPNL